MTSGISHQRFRGALVIGQLALSLVLLVGSGLLIRAFLEVSGTKLGFDPSTLVAHVSVPDRAYGGWTPQRADRLFYPALQRIRQLPGVTAAGMTVLVPVEDWGYSAGYWIDGQPEPAAGKEPVAEVRGISPDYFRAMAIPLEAGRDFNERDGPGAPRVAIVNEAFVRKALPGQSAIGRRIRRGTDTSNVFTIIGVAADVRQAGLEQPALPEMYVSYRNPDGYFLPTTFVVRGNLPTAELANAVRGALRSVAPDLPLYGVRTMGEVVGESMAARRLSMILLGLFASLALALAASGLYGVMAYGVAQRTREIGIRMALGAERGPVVAMVLRDGAKLVGAGLGIGIVASLLVTQWMASQLYGIGPRDPITLISVAVLLAAVSVMAMLRPARRAATVDPLIALRGD